MRTLNIKQKSKPHNTLTESTRVTDEFVLFSAGS